MKGNPPGTRSSANPGASPAGRSGRRGPLRPGRFRELRVRIAPPAHWVGELRDRWGVAVRVLHCEPSRQDPDRELRILELIADPKDADALSRFLERWLPPWAVWERIRGSGSFLVWATEPMLSTCRTARRLGAICLACPLAASRDDDGRVGWTLLVRAGPRSVRRALSDHSLAAEGSVLEAVGGFADESSLTVKQEIAVATAFQIGYFDFPRRAGLPALARILGVRPSTAQEHLRRGLAKILALRGSPGILRTAAGLG